MILLLSERISEPASPSKVQPRRGSPSTPRPAATPYCAHSVSSAGTARFL